MPNVLDQTEPFYERCHCMMLFHFALSCGFFLGPLIYAYITQEAGWRWSCGFLAIAGGVTFLVGFFTIRETNYPRPKADINFPTPTYPAKKSFIGWLSVTNGYDKEGSFFGTSGGSSIFLHIRQLSGLD